MKINLNNSREFTRENVAKLIGSVEDTQNWQLRVTSYGEAYLSEVVGNKNVEGLAFRFETWIFGNKHVGSKAQHDKEWVDRIFRALKKNWPNPTTTFVDFY